MKITFAGYSRTEPLADFPALIVLNTSITNFSYGQFWSASGHDLRFYDATTTNELDYEIENWDTNGSSHVWVRVPRLASGNESIWAFWGDLAKTNQPASATNGATWAADYRLVEHLGPSRDSSTNQIPVSETNMQYVAGGCIASNGYFMPSNQWLRVNHHAALKPASAMTISMWVKPDDLASSTYRELYRKEDSTSRHLLAFQGTGTILSFGLNLGGAYSEFDLSIAASNYVGGWHHVVATYDGTNRYFYRDGVEIGRQAATGAIGTAGTNYAYIGSSSGAAEFWDGSLDEVRVSGSARSSNWVWACYMNQKAGSAFARYDRVGGSLAFSADNGPAAGGNPVTITAGALGNGADITNVTVGGVAATITGQGVNWVAITMPAFGSTGAKDVVIQSVSIGDTTAFGAYTVNPAGQIGGWRANNALWTEVAGLPAARSDLAAGVLNGALYAVGGFDGIIPQTNVYRYNGTNWTEVAGLPAARFDLAAGALNGILYAGGGSDGSFPQANVYGYDGTSWSEVASLPNARSGLAVSELNGYLYAIGGTDGSSPQANVYRYDESFWTEVAALPAARADLAAGMSFGYLWAVGGSDGMNPQPAVAYYEDMGDVWIPDMDLPLARSDLGTGRLDGMLYAVGGYGPTSLIEPLPAVQSNVYVVGGGEIASLPAGRSGLAVGSLNDVLYAIGGKDGADTVKTNVYRYPGLVDELGVAPSSGSYAGGYAVVISGSNLCSGIDATNVTICGVGVAGIVSQSPTQIVVTVGAGSPGLGDVRVFSAGYGTTVRTNAFTYLAAPGIAVLGTNGAVVANGEAASVAKGTDFGQWLAGTAWTNTLSITNTGLATLTISGRTTNGAGAAAFSIAGIPASLAAGSRQDFTVRYAPPQGGLHEATLVIANNATNYSIQLRGSALGLSATSGPQAGGNTITITNGASLGNGSDVTNVLVGGVAATITGQGANWVTITMPAAGSAGVQDVVIQSTSIGVTTLSAAYTYNPSGQIGGWLVEDWTRWEEVAGLPAARCRLAAAELNGALYAVGGGSEFSAETNVYRYDGTNWTEVAGLPAARAELAVGVLDGALFAVGGVDGAGTPQTGVYMYDGESWYGDEPTVWSLPAARCRLAAGTAGGALYAIGGSDGAVPQANVYRYNGLDPWTEVAGLPSGARSDLAAGVQVGTLYAVGGWEQVDVMAIFRSDVFWYEEIGDSWTSGNGLPAARAELAAGELNGVLYAIGGSADFLGNPQTNVYRNVGLPWEEVAGLPEARCRLAAGALNGKLYAIGGYAGTPKTNVYRYPSTYVEAGVSPASGSVTGGYPVVIVGSNLCNGADVTNVTLCGASVAGIVSQSATQIVVTAGAGSFGLGDVKVYSASYGTTTKSNAFTYLLVPGLSIRGTNGVEVESGEGATVAKGTDFGSLEWGLARTNLLVLTNTGISSLNISGVVTNGAGANQFSISGIPSVVSTSAAVQFQVVFHPSAAVSYTGVVQIASDAPDSPFNLNLAGSGGKKAQTISFPAIGSKLTTDAVGLAATASSGLDVSFAVGSGPASLAGGTNLTFTGTGSVSIVASQAGNANWNAAPNVTNTFDVAKADQAALVFNPTSPQTYNTTNALAASGGSGAGALSFAVQSGPGQIVGTNGLIMQSGTGSVAVVATKAADALYNARSETGTVAAAKAGQTITFPAIGNQLTTGTVGLSATASSGLGVSFAIGSGPASIAGGTNLTFTGAGNVSIVASQAGNANWSAAPDATNTFNVAKADQAGLSFSPASPQVYNTTNALIATGGSGTGLVSYAVQSGPGQIVGTNGLKMLSGTGSVSVVATRAADALYHARSATGAVAAEKADQAALSFSPASPQTYNTTNALGATGGSGTGVVSYAVQSGPGQIVGTNGLKMLSGTGSVAVLATKAADALYAVCSATGTVAAAKAGQTITFPAIGDKITTNVVGLAATASSGLGVSFAVGSGPATISGGTNLAFTGAGSVSIVASQAGDAMYNPAPNATNTFNVDKAMQGTLYFKPSSPQAFGTTNALMAAGGSGTGAVSYAVQSGPGQIGDALGTKTLKVTGTGTVSVVATKAAEARYLATSTTSHVAAVKAGQTIAFAALGDQWVTNRIGLEAMASSGLGVGFAVASGPASIAGGTNLTFTGGGTVSIVASQAGDANWLAAPSVTNTFRSVSLAVTNVNACQVPDGSGRVQIDYTLRCQPTSQVASVGLAFSTNGGVSWTAMSAGAVTGDYGAAVASGSRTAVWSAALQLSSNTLSANHRVRLTATAGSETVTNVSGLFSIDLKGLYGGLTVRGNIRSATTLLPLSTAVISLAGSTVTQTLSYGSFTLTNVGIIHGNVLTVSNANYVGCSRPIWIPAGAKDVTVSRIYLQPQQPGQPVVTSFKPALQGLFFNGWQMPNEFTASVDWNGLVPNQVEFYAGDTVQGPVSYSPTNQYSCTIDMGSAFQPSWNLRANKVDVRVRGYDAVTYEMASATSTVYVCVFPGPDWLNGLFSMLNPGEIGIEFSVPPEPVEAKWSLPVLKKLGFKVGVPVSFGYSIPDGGEWELNIGRARSKEWGPEEDGDKKTKTALLLGDAEMEIVIAGIAKGVANMERGIALDSVGLHGELNVKFKVFQVGLLDLVPGATTAAVAVFGADGVIAWFTVQVYASPGLEADFVVKTADGLQFDSFDIAGKIGVEGAYEPKVGPFELRAYLGGEPSVQVGFPGDFLKALRFRAYAGLEIKAWFFKYSAENVFVDSQWPAPGRRGAGSGDPQFAILQGAGNNQLQTLDRNYLEQGRPRFLASEEKQKKNAAGISPLDDFRAMRQFSASGSVQGQGARKSSPHAKSQANLLLIDNVFPDSAPSMASASSNLMMLFVGDNGSESDLQYTDIQWTRFDGSNWSEPAPIATDTRGEFDPKVRYDGNGDAIAVWNRVRDPDFTELDLAAMAAQMEIVWSRWDHDAGTWTAPVALTTNAWLDHMPQLDGPMANGDLIATWVENPANLLIGTGAAGATQNDSVAWAQWSVAAQSWSAPQPLVSNLTGRGSQSLSASGETAAYAWTADADGDVGDDTDQEVYLKIWTNGAWSAALRCTSNEVADRNVRVALSPVGAVHLVWQQESNLVSSMEMASDPVLVRPDSGSAGFADFAMTYGPMGNMVLLWQEMTTNGSDAHYSVFDVASGTWSKDATLFQDAPLERSFAPVWDDAGNLTVAYNAVDIAMTNVVMELDGGGSITVSNVPQPGAVSLAVVKRTLITDVAILPGDFVVVGDNYLPGDAVTLSAVLRNVGDVAVTNAAVSFYVGDPEDGGQIITNLVWDGWLEGAATDAVLSATWVIPEPATNPTLFAVANPDHAFAEFTENNNTQAVSVGGTDLSVTLLEATAETNGSVFVIAQIENLGAPGATNTTLAIRRQGESGTPLATVTVPALPPGMIAQVAVELPDGTQPEGNAHYTLNTDEEGIVWDVETNNNAITFAVNLWLDSDGDGMPDGWESDNDLDPNSPADASGDEDDDGMGNYAEWRAGTDPNDESSYLGVVACVSEGVPPLSQGFRLTWGSVSNRFYTISRATNLVKGLGFAPIAEHIQADPPENTYQDTTLSTNAAKYYYRIDLE